MRIPARDFLHNRSGATGAEKALLICFGLALIGLISGLLSSGGKQASKDAERTLKAGQAALSTPGSLGQVMGPNGLYQAVAPLRAPAPLSAPTPLAGGGSDKSYDGTLSGADGKSYPSGTPLSQIPPVKPSDGREPNGTIIYVNGIGTTKDGHMGTLQPIADRTGAQVIGVYNATDGFVKDLWQSLGDKVDLGKNPAVDTLSSQIYTEINAGRSVHLMGHSQGGLILSRALSDVKRRLMIEDGLTRAQAEDRMAQIRVETFGAAATSYPDGPKYTHYINRLDPVPVTFGLGPIGSIGAGRGAKIVRFNDANTQVDVGWKWPPVSVKTDPHGFQDVYLPRRQP